MVVVTGSRDLSAQTNAVATGNWSDPATWSAGEPTSTSEAIINGGFTVTIDQAGETTNLLDVGTVSGQTGNLNMTGGDLFINDSDTVTAPNIPSIRIGQALGSVGNFNMSGGTVFIGGGADTGFAIGDLIIGDAGTGTMTMTGGDLEASDEIIIGLADVSSGTVNVSGGNFKTSGRSILVGFDGPGKLNVSDTGSVFANFDLFVGFVEGSSGELTMSGGTVESGFMFSNFLSGGAGSTATITQTGGTYNARIAYVLGQGHGTTTMNHSGGAINCPTNNGDFVVSDGDLNTSVYNISGTATVNLLHDFIVGAFNGSNGTVNQTGGSITSSRNLRIGADGTGVWNLNGGTVNAQNIFLGDFDDSTGTIKISGGTLTLTGNLSVGGALASNAAPDRVEPDGTNGPQGQALTARGNLIVSGNGGTISVAGNLLANPSDKSPFRSHPFAPGGNNVGNLVFEIFNSSGTSLIDVAGKGDLDGSLIDIDLMSGFTPTAGATFDLIDAAMGFGSTGTGTTENVGTGKNFTLLAEDVGVFSLAFVASGGGEILRATFLGAAGVLGDYNNNGIVDGADYVLWRNGGPLANDPTPGVQAADYDFWRSRFGATSGSGAGLGQPGAVPEPTAVLLLLIGAAMSVRRSIRKN
jgi:T5SS/PEP-CTERM-associated repeat protein